MEICKCLLFDIAMFTVTVQNKSIIILILQVSNFYENQLDKQCCSQARVQESSGLRGGPKSESFFFFFLLFNISGGGGPAQKIAEKTTISNTRATFAYYSFCDNLRLNCTSQSAVIVGCHF